MEINRIPADKDLKKSMLIIDWSVYIVKCSDDSLYTGISNNVTKRIETHNNGKGTKYTRSRKPVYLVYSKVIGNRSEASKEEHRIKKLSRKEKLKLL